MRLSVSSRDFATQGEDDPSCGASLTGAPLTERDAVDLSKVFAALADPVRLRLFSIVASSSQVCSCALEVPLMKSQSTVSHHTKILAEAGLIVGEKKGRWVWWSVNLQELAKLRGLLGDGW